jgi:hypothetical protein
MRQIAALSARLRAAEKLAYRTNQAAAKLARSRGRGASEVLTVWTMTNAEALGFLALVAALALALTVLIAHVLRTAALNGMGSIARRERRSGR